MIRKYFFLLAVVSLCIGCASTPTTITSHRNDVYIYDFATRLSQSKLRAERENYYSSTVGVAVINTLVLVVDASDNYLDISPDSYLSFPRTDIKSISIRNKGKSTMHFNLTTNRMVDKDSEASLRKVLLPAGKKMNILVIDKTDYLLEYWTEKMCDKESATELIHTDACSQIRFTKENSVVIW